MNASKMEKIDLKNKMFKKEILRRDTDRERERERERERIETLSHTERQ